MTDHGTQFTSLPRDGKESEPNEFQKYLEENNKYSGRAILGFNICKDDIMRIFDMRYP
jgi:hypothetical protein